MRRNVHAFMALRASENPCGRLLATFNLLAWFTCRRQAVARKCDASKTR